MSDFGNLQGKVALVTGSGRGLGYAIATRLSQLGASVAIHDRNEEAPAEFGEHTGLQDAVGKLPGKAVGVIGDIADEDEVARMVREAEAALGPIEVLVNCAGGDIAAKGGKPNPNGALNIKLEDARAILDRNFIGTMLMCRAVVPSMVERGSGSVINIASAAAHFGVPAEVVYASVKAAIVHYTRCMAAELRPQGVRANCVSPGPTKTGRFLATRTTNPEMMEVGSSLVRYAEPAEIADAVAFLASDASRFIHGQVLRVDGGLTLFPG